MPDGSLPTSVVRVLDPAGEPVGAGVVLDRHVVTCAHVVNLALGLDERSADRPAGPVTVDFPALGGAPVTAEVGSWSPPPPREGAPGDDVAVLAPALPAGVTPARLTDAPPRAGRQVDVFGYPGNRPDGAWVRAVMRGQVGNGLLQLDSESALAVGRGYSGSPVWDPGTGRVVGIVAAAASRDCYAITADRLRRELPDQAPGLTVLHLFGTRFGSGRPLPGGFAETRPDLVVFTGDLTEHGRPDEFEQGFRFLAEVADAVRLPRHRVVVVPGVRDVNLLACRAYFTQEEAWGRVPTHPHWPKWGPFAAAFEEFYGGRFGFTPDEPWTLFDHPDLRLAVAGVNSTIEVTHERDDAEPGDRQVERFQELFRERRRRGWWRVSAVQGPLGSSVSLDVDLTFTSLRHEPAAWSLVPLPELPERAHPWRDRAERSGGKPAAFFERVLEATRVAHPTATVTPRPDQDYLRVCKPRDGVGVEQWPVGVADEPRAADVDRFVERVHASFAAADPSVPSELVYSGPPAGPDLVRRAQRAGVRLRSFVEYQGLLDLRPLAERQARRLAGDAVYPAELYVPQRYAVARSDVRGDDLLDRVLGWLREDVARFLVVLGDFGRGKSFLLRQLTRALPREHPALLPVLVELRNLEKAPSLDELLAQHLVREGVEAVDVNKLRYMIGSGRLALLFDGFDELELRVGYDNAAEYLKTLLAAVTDRAKVVLTSRTQHFQSTDQVLNALGQQVSALAASRVVVLEDFTDDQIRDFLTRHYHGDEERAAARFELLGAVSDLLGLSRNPRMLSFIADLDEARLLEVQQQHGRISAAELYRELVDFWLLQEAGRQRHRYGTPSFDEAERLSACTALALRLWKTTATTIRTSDLEDTVVRTLTGLVQRGYSIDQATHAVGSGSLLVRTEEGGFAFVHQSVMEWLVAKVAADELPATAIVTRRMSRLMVDFLCDLAGHGVALSWARGALADPGATEAAKQNATDVVRRLEVVTRLVLAGKDLRGFDFGELDLRGADLSGADLSGQRLHGKSFAGADLTGANLSDVRLVGGDLTGAVLTGSRWTRAALLGVSGPAPADAAVTGRDAATPTLAPLGQDVVAAAFSPDGELVALAREHVVELVSLSTQRTARVWRRHSRPITDVAYAPNGRLIATVEDDGAAHVWHAQTGEPVCALAGRLLDRVRFTEGSDRLVGQDADRVVRFWDARTGEAVAALPDAQDDLEVSPDGSLLSTRLGARLAIRRTEDLEVIATAEASRGSHLAFTPDDSTLAVVEGNRVTLLEAHSGWPAEEFPAPFHPTNVAFLDDHRLGFTDDFAVVVLDIATEEEWRFDADSGVLAFTPSPDGTRFLITSTDGWATVHTGRADPMGQPLTSGWRSVGSASYSPNGRLLLTTCDDGRGRTWDLVTGEVRDEFEAREAFGRLACFAPTGSRVAYASAAGRVHVTGDGHQHIEIGDQAESLAFSRDGRRLLIAVGVTCEEYDETGRLLRRLTSGTAVNAVAYSPVLDLIATAHDDGSARVWHGDEPMFTLSGHTQDVWAVAFSPNGRHIATASSDGTARVWDVRGRQLMTLEGHGRTVWDVAFSPDGMRLVTASSDGTARVWGDEGRHLLTLTGHTARVRSVAYSPDGQRIATTSEDGTARIWDAMTGAELAVLVHSGDGAVLLPDGSYKGDAGDRLFWAVKQCRFEAGELDPYYPEIRRLAPEEPLPGVVAS